jgi:hypothetical protein
MALVADYIVVHDAQFQLTPASPSRNFVINVPNNAALGSPAILSMMVKTISADDIDATIEVNGQAVTNFVNADGLNDRAIHEVFAGSVLNAGNNTVAFDLTAGTGTLQLSDVIVWFQANTA